MAAVFAGCNPKEDNSYEFSKGSVLPVVDFKVNGVWTSFLVDTGAELSMVSERFVGRNIDKFKIIDTIHIASITANGVENIDMYHTKGIVNDTIPVCFLVSDFSDAASEMSKNCGKEVAGILGFDFIKDNKVVFDFEKRELPKNKTK